MPCLPEEESQCLVYFRASANRSNPHLRTIKLLLCLHLSTTTTPPSTLRLIHRYEAIYKTIAVQLVPKLPSLPFPASQSPILLLTLSPRQKQTYTQFQSQIPIKNWTRSSLSVRPSPLV